jgi:hypothetical protein
MNSKERDFIEWLKLSSANVTVVPPPAGFSSSALARWIIKAGYPCGNVGWESFAVGAAIPTTKFADKNVVVFMAEGPDDPTPEAFEFYGLSVTYVVTDDSPDKILRKVAAARIVAEHLNESAFRTFNGTQPENLSVTGETLLAEFMNAGIAVSGWVATGLSAYQISPIVQRVYPGKTTVLFDGEYAQYGQAWMTELISSGKPVVIIGQHFTAFRYWAVATDDSPDKVVRKLHMALSTEESLSESFVAYDGVQRSITVRAAPIQHRLISRGVIITGWIKTDLPPCDVEYAVIKSCAYSRSKVILADARADADQPYALDVDAIEPGTRVVILACSVKFSNVVILLVTDDPLEKVVRKLTLIKAREESLTESFKPVPDDKARHDDFGFCIDAVYRYEPTKVSCVDSTARVHGERSAEQIIDMARKVYGEDRADFFRVINTQYGPLSTGPLARAIPGHGVILVKQPYGPTVAVVTDDTQEKFIRRMTAADGITESWVPSGTMPNVSRMTYGNNFWLSIRVLLQGLGATSIHYVENTTRERDLRYVVAEVYGLDNTTWFPINCGPRQEFIDNVLSLIHISEPTRPCH